MDIEQTINDYYTNNQERIRTVATKIFKRKNLGHLVDSVINSSYLHVYDNKDKPKVKALIENGKIESIVVNYIYKQASWPGSSVKIDFVDQKHTSIEVISTDFLKVDPSVEEEELELRQEAEFEEQSKLAHIEGQKQKLPYDRRILYKLTLDEKMSVTKLAKYLKLNRTSCWKMTKNLKLFLKKGYKE